MLSAAIWLYSCWFCAVKLRKHKDSNATLLRWSCRQELCVLDLPSWDSRSAGVWATDLHLLWPDSAPSRVGRRFWQHRCRPAPGGPSARHSVWPHWQCFAVLTLRCSFFWVWPRFSGSLNWHWPGLEKWRQMLQNTVKQPRTWIRRRSALWGDVSASGRL